MAAHRSLASPPEQARKVLAEQRVDLRHDLRPAAARWPRRARAQPQPVGPAPRRRGAGLARAGRATRRAGVRRVPGEAIADDQHRSPGLGRRNRGRAVLPGRAAALLGRAARRRGARSHLRRYDPLLPAGPRRHDPGRRGVGRRQRRRQHAGAEVSASGPHHRRRPGRGRGVQGQPIRRSAYRRIEANRPLPFADKAFDIAVSNAVLEHVGSRPHQAAFVRELCRVAKTVFISVPNRYFPVEHHTAIPLLHFWTRSFELACRWLGKAEWADESNLILMSWQRPRRAGAGRGRPGHRPHRHQARAVQLESVSVHRAGAGGRADRQAPAGARPVFHRRAIKSLRRKGSLLYEPRRRTDAAKR